MTSARDRKSTLRRVAARDEAAATRTIAIRDERGGTTYGDLVADADVLAAGLTAAGVTRFAIVSNDIPAVVALLAASSIIGAEACVYAPDITADALAQQAKALAHHIVVTTRDDLGDNAIVDLRRVEDLRRQPAGAQQPGRPRPAAAPRPHDWDDRCPPRRSPRLVAPALPQRASPGRQRPGLAAGLRPPAVRWSAGADPRLQQWRHPRRAAGSAAAGGVVDDP